MPSLSDLKAHLNMTSTIDDSELLTKLDAAVDLVEGVVGPVYSTARTETHYGVDGPTVVLQVYPVSAVSAVSYRYTPSTVVTSYVNADYVFDADTGVLRLANGSWFRGDVTVTYSAGRTLIPAGVDQAILIVAGHLWQTQRGASPMPMQAVDMGASPGSGYALPNRALELLARYQQAPKVGG